MSLRQRMVLLTAAAVALAVVFSAAACYLAVQRSLRSRIDHQLEDQAGLIAAASKVQPKVPRYLPRGVHAAPAPASINLPQPSLQTQGDLELVSASGAVYRRPGDHTHLAVTPHDLAVARGTAKAYFRDALVAGTPVRVYVAPAGRGHAVIALQALTDLDNTLHDLAAILIAIALAGIALAGLLGLLVARAAAAPVHLLRQAAEHVRSTGDLGRRIDVPGGDDLGRLGRSFNEMLETLAESRRAQQQLVADASHELRTPVATLRTNLEVLARNPDLAAEERAPLLRDLIGESAELSILIEDLLETARDGDEGEVPEVVALDALIESEVEQWGRRNPGIVLRCTLEPMDIDGRESRLRRALANLLDNAIKWSPPGAPIEVALAGRRLTVRDHGPGFDASDLPHVFDRFYRASTARTVPGSGLGLSIVRKVAEEHEAAVCAENASGGGAIVTICFPPSTRDDGASPGAGRSPLSGLYG